MKKTFYVTTPLYYVNDKPHIGHAYTTIAADILAKWYKQEGSDVFFLTGTDEHGQKILESAQKAKITPRKFTDKLVPFFKNAWKNLHIEYNHFIRTTDEYHEQTAQKFFKKLLDKGDIYKGSYNGLYCVGCENYLTEKDLVNGKCPLHDRAPTVIKEDGYFFKLSKYQDALLDLYEQRKDFVLPKTRLNEVRSRVEAGLQDLFISRKVWGVKIPGEKELTLYCWFEALLNYISGLKWPGATFKKYWPANVHLIGKDILWFHAAVWPAMLLAAEIEPPHTVFAHGFFTVDGRKMSKTLGNFIDPNPLVKTYGSDAVRYAMFRNTPFGQDGDFSEKALVERHNGELANEFGNLLSRVVSMISKYNDGKIPGGKLKLKADFKTASMHIEKYDLNTALEDIWSFVREVNKYIQDNKPWELFKTDKKKLNDVLFNSACALRDICALAWPFVPDGAEKAAKQLGLKKVPGFADIGKPLKGKVVRSDAIYPRLAYIPEVKIFNLDIKAGKIIKIEEVPKSEKLYKIQIDFGAFKKQAVAGLKPYFKKSELLNKEFVFLVNLAPAKLAGIKSECMILAVEDGSKIDLLKPSGKIELEGFEPKPAKQVNLKDFASWKLKVRDGKVISGRAKALSSVDRRSTSGDAVLSGVKSKFKKGKVA